MGWQRRCSCSVRGQKRFHIYLLTYNILPPEFKIFMLLFFLHNTYRTSELYFSLVSPLFSLTPSITQIFIWPHSTYCYLYMYLAYMNQSNRRSTFKMITTDIRIFWTPPPTLHCKGIRKLIKHCPRIQHIFLIFVISQFTSEIKTIFKSVSCNNVALPYFTLWGYQKLKNWRWTCYHSYQESEKSKKKSFLLPKNAKFLFNKSNYIVK